jgi:hypothetical protein
MVFDVYGNDRLIAWKQFRDLVENSNSPLDDVAELWSHAPFVNDYLDPTHPSTWPDPWKLIIDLKLDSLAIALGMLYTIKLTKRFENNICEIQSLVDPIENKTFYILVVDGTFILNLEYRKVLLMDAISKLETNILWSVSRIK